MANKKGSQSDIVSLESPSSDVYRSHRRLRYTRRDTAVGRSILDHVGHSQSETEIRSGSVDNHVGDDSNGTGEDDTVDDDDPDYEGGTESESEGEQGIAEDLRPRKRQRPNMFGPLLSQSPSILDEPASSSAPSTRYPNKMSVLAHPSDPCHLTQVAASTASSNAGEESFTALGSADFDSMRLAIRRYLDIQYVGSVPYYSLLFQQDEVSQRL
jgi:hypothetical protein